MILSCLGCPISGSLSNRIMSASCLVCHILGSATNRRMLLSYLGYLVLGSATNWRMLLSCLGYLVSRSVSEDVSMLPWIGCITMCVQSKIAQFGKHWQFSHHMFFWQTPGLLPWSPVVIEVAVVMRYVVAGQRAGQGLWWPGEGVWAKPAQYHSLHNFHVVAGFHLRCQLQG